MRGNRRRSPTVVRRLTHRVGFRGMTLLLLAAVDFAYGRTFIQPDPGQQVVNDYLSAAIPFAGPEVSRWAWAIAWWITGLFCLVNAFRREDRWGYGMAIALKVAYIVAIVSGGLNGMPNSTVRGIVWGFITAWVVVEARRAEPHRDIGAVAREMEETGDLPRVEGRGEDA
jgi:branched-subunit amino acid ABC-type transport system permease component